MVNQHEFTIIQCWIPAESCGGCGFPLTAINLQGANFAIESLQNETLCAAHGCRVAPLAHGSPVSILSLTWHSPASRTASQGSSRPSWGRTRQSPGTRSKEVTHSSSEKSEKETPRNKCFARKQHFDLQYVASRGPRIKSKKQHSRLFSQLKLMKHIQSHFRQNYFGLNDPFYTTLLTKLRVSFQILFSPCSCDSNWAEAKCYDVVFFLQEKMSHSWEPFLTYFSIDSIYKKPPQTLKRNSNLTRKKKSDYKVTSFILLEVSFHFTIFSLFLF